MSVVFLQDRTAPTPLVTGPVRATAARSADPCVPLGSANTRRQPLARIERTRHHPVGSAPTKRPLPPAGYSDTLRHVQMTLSWHPIASAQHSDVPVELDATALLFGGSPPRGLLDAVYFAKFSSTDGAVRHLGTTSAEHVRHEIITLDLPRIRPNVTDILFVVTSYRGHRLGTVADAGCRFLDSISNTELARLELTGTDSATGIIAARLRRGADGWRLHAIGAPLMATHPVEAIPQLRRYLN